MNQRADLIDDDPGLERGVFSRAQRDAMLDSLAGIVPGENGTRSSYNLVDSAGVLFGFGGAPFPGSLAGLALHRPIVGASIG